MSEPIIAISPLSGTGDKGLSISAQEHTGRLDRSVSFTAYGVSSSISSANRLVVRQLAKPAFINLTSSGTAPSSGGTVTLSGYSNLAGIQFSQGATNDLLSLLTSAAVNGVSLGSDVLTALRDGTYVEVTGDPGASSEYAVTLSFAIPASQSQDIKIYSMGVVTPSGATTQVSVSQEAAQITRNVLFTSNISSDTMSGDIEITINVDGDAFVDGSSTRQIKVEPTPGDLSWSVTLQQES